MANISAVIVPAKALADGKQKVRLAVSHNGATRYIVTDITGLLSIIHQDLDKDKPDQVPKEPQ
jgi:hypothetical protein